MARSLFLAFLAFVLSCAQRPAVPDPVSDAALHPRPDLRFEQLAEGVWMHTAYRELPRWGRVPSNGLLVVDGERSVLVDTGWDDAQTAAILEWAKTVLGRPVVAAVLTHAHDDTMGGIATLRARGVETWAHPQTNVLAAAHGLAPAAHDLSLDADGAAHASGSTALDRLEVLFPGPAHTADNLVVHVPGSGVLFGGCLVRSAGATSLGNVSEADVTRWAEAAARVARRFGEARIVVPGHGRPGGPELVAETRELAEETARRAAKGATERR